MAGPLGVMGTAASPAPSSGLQLGKEPTGCSQNVLRGCGSSCQMFLVALATWTIGGRRWLRRDEEGRKAQPADTAIFSTSSPQPALGILFPGRPWGLLGVPLLPTDLTVLVSDVRLLGPGALCCRAAMLAPRHTSLRATKHKEMVRDWKQLHACAAGAIWTGDTKRPENPTDTFEDRGAKAGGCACPLHTAPPAAAAAAKSLQSCPTLCDPRDGSPPGSSVHGILQWVAISFSNAGKWNVKVKPLSRVQLCATPWTAAHQAPPSMGFARQEYWSGAPLPSLTAPPKGWANHLSHPCSPTPGHTSILTPYKEQVHPFSRSQQAREITACLHFPLF